MSSRRKAGGNERRRRQGKGAPARGQGAGGTVLAEPQRQDREQVPCGLCGGTDLSYECVACERSFCSDCEKAGRSQSCEGCNGSICQACFEKHIDIICVPCGTEGHVNCPYLHHLFCETCARCKECVGGRLYFCYGCDDAYLCRSCFDLSVCPETASVGACSRCDLAGRVIEAFDEYRLNQKLSNKLIRRAGIRLAEVYEDAWDERERRTEPDDLEEIAWECLEQAATSRRWRGALVDALSSLNTERFWRLSATLIDQGIGRPSQTAWLRELQDRIAAAESSHRTGSEEEFAALQGRLSTFQRRNGLLTWSPGSRRRLEKLLLRMGVVPFRKGPLYGHRFVHPLLRPSRRSRKTKAR